MRYSLETPFVRSAAEDAWGHSRPTPSALRRCATPPPARPRSADLIAYRSSGGARPRERSRLQLTPDSVGGTRIDADAPRSAAADTLQHRIYSGTALRCISPSPLYPRTRCPGLTENGSALRTSSSTLSSASPVVAHLRRALCGSRAATPCVLAALIRMGLLKIARLQRADIASSPPHRHHHRTHRRGATTLCHNPVRGAQHSVPGLNTPLLSACRRYATTPEPESDRASGHAFS